MSQPGAVVIELSGTAAPNAAGGPMSLELPVEDLSRVGEARRAAAAVAERLNCGEDARGRLALVVTELATNLARHAREGRLFVRAIVEGSSLPTVEVLAVDSGPGIADLGSALEDGFSTGGTRGAGLGAMRRMADDFDVQSARNVGTVVLARVRDRELTGAAAPARSGVICRPYPGEDHCGDGWMIREDAERTVVVVVDGLGHGPAAAEVAVKGIASAESVLADQPRATAERILEVMHEALRSTRGAAAAATVIERGEGRLHFAGVGNIVGAIVAPGEQRSLVSHNGILGHQVRRVQGFTHSWPTNGLLVMHSDGLGSRWRLDPYPGIATRDPAILAAVLYRDFARGRDDATVVVTRASGRWTE